MCACVQYIFVYVCGFAHTSVYHVWTSDFVITFYVKYVYVCVSMNMVGEYFIPRLCQKRLFPSSLSNNSITDQGAGLIYNKVNETNSIEAVRLV